LAANLGGGQVDITPGKLVFSAAETYLTEDKVGPAVKGATLIGNAPDARVGGLTVGGTA
jgi:TldD protein